jgi:hypothetical protein
MTPTAFRSLGVRRGDNRRRLALFASGRRTAPAPRTTQGTGRIDGAWSAAAPSGATCTVPPSTPTAPRRVPMPKLVRKPGQERAEAKRHPPVSLLSLFSRSPCCRQDSGDDDDRSSALMAENHLLLDSSLV